MADWQPEYNSSVRVLAIDISSASRGSHIGPLWARRQRCREGSIGMRKLDLGEAFA